MVKYPIHFYHVIHACCPFIKINAIVPYSYSSIIRENKYTLKMKKGLTLTQEVHPIRQLAWHCILQIEGSFNYLLFQNILQRKLST